MSGCKVADGYGTMLVIDMKLFLILVYLKVLLLVLAVVVAS